MSIGKVAVGIDKITPKTPSGLRVVFTKPAGNESGLNIATINANDYITKQMFLDNTSNAPLALLGVNSNTVQGFYAGDYIKEIFIIGKTGSPSMNVGLTNGGTDFFSGVVGVYQPLIAQQYFVADGNIYFNISGGGSVNIYIYYYNNIL